MIAIRHPNRQAYNWLAYELGERFLEASIPLLRGVLYDLGSGESPYREFFLRHAAQYVAVDWAGSLHRTRADVEANLNEPLPIASGAADTVVALAVLEHLCEPQAMLCESYRILRSGGALVMQVPWQWWVHEAPHDYFRYTPHGLAHLLQKAGFIDIRIEPQSGFFAMIVLKMNYFSMRLVRGPQPLRLALRGLLSGFWYLGQKLAPWLDRMDGQWSLETMGYHVTARKP